MTTSYPYPFVVKMNAADIAALTTYQGDTKILRDEYGRTWSWNGTGYGQGDNAGTGVQDSLDPPSPGIAPSSRAVAAAVAPVNQLQATIATQATIIAGQAAQITAMQQAIIALQSAVLPSGSGALTLTAPTITGSTAGSSGSPFPVGSTITFVSGTVGNGTAVTTTWTLASNGTVVVSGATANTYVIPASIGSTSISVTQAVTNAAGQTTRTTSTVYYVGVAPAVPVMVTPPTITGSASVGNTLTATHGTYTNNSGLTYSSYAWKNGSTVLGTSLTLVITDAMVGLSITFSETPHNSAGDGAVATSAAIIVAGGSTPVNTVAPGWKSNSTFAVGGVLYFDPGVWTGNPDPTLDVYGILRDGVAISVSINPANPTYTCVAADQDKTLTPTLIRRNSGSAASPMAQGAGEAIAAGIGGSSPTSSFGTLTTSALTTATAGSNGFLLLPTAAGPITKSGGAAITYTAVGGSLADDTANALPAISFSGGTPTASGTVTTGLKASWGTVGAGIQFTINIPSGASTVVVPVCLYGIVALVTASLADSSASPSTINVDAGNATTSLDSLVSIPVTAGSATQMIVKVVQQTLYASGAGDSHFMGAWL